MVSRPVQTGTMEPLVIGAWIFVTAYIFVGIEDVGSQVYMHAHRHLCTCMHMGSMDARVH